METFSALLALWSGNSPVSGEFPAQRPVTRSFDVFFDLHLIKRLSKHSRGWWFETLSRPFWRHCNVDKSHKCHNAPAPYPAMHQSEQKRAHVSSEWYIAGYGTSAFWNLWYWSMKCFTWPLPPVRPSVAGEWISSDVSPHLVPQDCHLLHVPLPRRRPPSRGPPHRP